MTRPKGYPPHGFTNLEQEAYETIVDYALGIKLEDLAQLGQGWYESANASVRAVARSVDRGLGRGLVEATAHVMAILSPMMKWEDSMVDAYVLLTESRYGPNLNHRYMALGKNVDLARRYLDGDYVPVGPKVKAFAQNLYNPWAWGPVTLDGRMAKMLHVNPLSISKGPLAQDRYDALSRAFIRVAADLDLETPQGLQAGIWMMERSKKKGRTHGPS